jgi:hypothetical protein
MHASYFKEKKRDHSKKHNRNTHINTKVENAENCAQDETRSEISENSVTIQNLPFNIISNIFSFLCLRDLCTVEKGK